MGLSYWYPILSSKCSYIPDFLKEWNGGLSLGSGVAQRLPEKGHLLGEFFHGAGLFDSLLDWRYTILSVSSSLVSLRKLVASPEVWQLAQVDVKDILICRGEPLIRIFLMLGNSGDSCGVGLLW